MAALEQRNGPPVLPAPIPLIDPTANVLELVRQEARRQDGLREAEGRRIDEISRIGRQDSEKLQAERLQWQKDLTAAESRRIDAQALAESRRIDALLAAAAAERAIERIRTEQTAVALAERVDAAQKALATTAGGDVQRIVGRQGTQWGIQIAIGFLGVLVAVLTVVVLVLLSQPHK